MQNVEIECCIDFASRHCHSFLLQVFSSIFHAEWIHKTLLRLFTFSIFKLICPCFKGCSSQIRWNIFCCKCGTLHLDWYHGVDLATLKDFPDCPLGFWLSKPNIPLVIVLALRSSSTLFSRKLCLLLRPFFNGDDCGNFQQPKYD